MFLHDDCAEVGDVDSGSFEDEDNDSDENDQTMGQMRGRFQPGRQRLSSPRGR